MSPLAGLAAIGLGSVAVIIIFELWPRDWLSALWADLSSIWWGK
jgi:hypothetical protein